MLRPGAVGAYPDSCPPNAGTGQERCPVPRSSASTGMRYRTRGQERRDHRYELKLSASEHIVLATAAGRDSLTLAAYLVKAGLDRAEHRTAPVGAVQREMAARLIELADFVNGIQTSLSQAET